MTDPDTTTWWFVSRDPEQLTPPDDDRADLPHYRTDQDAIDAIKNDQHGEIGTLYVIKADLSVAAMATRAWELIKGERPTTPAPDPEEDRW
jgi:hypothetical protein